MAAAAVLRSPMAHARLGKGGRDGGAAAPRRAADPHRPRTVAADGIGNIPCTHPLVSRDGRPRHDNEGRRPVWRSGKCPPRRPAVALVVAETLNAARGRGGGRSRFDYEALPSVVASPRGGGGG